MTNKRLEIIEKLKQCEERKLYFENALNDLVSPYTKKVEIMVDIKSESYNKKHINGEYVKADIQLMSDYIKSEISNCEETTLFLFEELQGGMK